jgi:hypothetical protein
MLAESKREQAGGTTFLNAENRFGERIQAKWANLRFKYKKWRDSVGRSGEGSNPLKGVLLTLPKFVEYAQSQPDMDYTSRAPGSGTKKTPKKKDSSGDMSEEDLTADTPSSSRTTHTPLKSNRGKFTTGAALMELAHGITQLGDAMAAPPAAIIAPRDVLVGLCSGSGSDAVSMPDEARVWLKSVLRMSIIPKYAPIWCLVESFLRSYREGVISVMTMVTGIDEALDGLVDKDVLDTYTGPMY